uniref:Putative secreted protein n=1 Tax=Ixodes ricinus TaxID=34613 RepID=A0A147BJL8_IXORI
MCALLRVIIAYHFVPNAFSFFVLKRVKKRVLARAPGVDFATKTPSFPRLICIISRARVLSASCTQKDTIILNKKNIE